jgi:tetratricopeptide (TPR) repeat protein
MGVVYRARQISLNRPVALKMIAAGQLASPGQVQRFQLEAEAAARLDHPNIVPIYEVGAHHGQHFYAMKLLEGGPLSRWMASGPAHLSDREVARLVVTIARAVQYAHERGVLHRDLKPTNILLDAHGQPQVTDFGLAKLFEEDPFLTPSAAVLGTPAYMAPEIAAGQAAGATTAADIYGLGAILYELLTGRPPFVAESLPVLLRKIVEESPAPMTSRAARELPKPSRDLEIICRKCLEKNPASRYASALGLAEDLEHWLAGESIVARPASVAEQTWRWCRRKPALAILSGSLVLALGAGVTGMAWAWQRAKADEERARTEAAKTREFARFLHQMLYRVGPSVSLGRDTTLLREILDQAAARMGGPDLTNQPAAMADLHDTIGHTYHDVGDYAKAAAMHRESVRLRRALGQTPSFEMAQSLHLLAMDLSHLNELAEAETLDREALAMRIKLFGPNDGRVGDSLNNLGTIYFRRTNLAMAQQYHEQALEIYRKSKVTNVNAVLNNLANILTLRHDYVGAEKLYREAIAMARQNFGDAHPTTALYLRNLGDVLRGQGRLKEADAVHSEALAVRASMLDELHPLLADSLERLAIVKGMEGRWSEAELLYRKALAARRKQAPNNPRQWEDDASALADILNQDGRFDETDRLLTELLAAAPPDDPRSARLFATRGNAHGRAGRWLEAAPDIARAFELAPSEYWYAHVLGPLVAHAGDLAAYEKHCRRCLAQFGDTTNVDIAARMGQACLWAPVDPSILEGAGRLLDFALASPKYAGRPYAIASRALLDYRANRPTEAILRLEELLRDIEAKRSRPGRFVPVQAHTVLSLAHQALGEEDQARAAYAQALAVAPAKIATPTNGDYGTWHEWLGLHVHLREARTRLERSSPVTNSPAPSSPPPPK